MDNPNPPRSKPLGYDAMKAVIKSMSCEKRQALHTHIPQLRTINSTVPYKLEKVSIQRRFIQINNKRWNFEKTGNNGGYEYLEANDIANLDMELVSNPYSIRPIKKCYFQLNKPYEKLYNSVVDAYLQNGVVIGKLNIGINYPNFLNKRNSENWKMKVSKIAFHRAVDYETMVPYLDLSQLECVYFSLQNNTIKMFERPEEWAECPRPVGSRFTMYNIHVPSILDVIATNLGAVTAQHPRKVEGTRCASLKMSDGNILIFHHVDDPSRLEIEVFEGVKSDEDVEDGEPSEKRVRQQ